MADENKPPVTTPPATAPATAPAPAKPPVTTPPATETLEQQVARLTALVITMMAPAAGPVAKTPLTDAERKTRNAARKELRIMHKVNRKDPKHNPASFDDQRFHALHYLAAGKPVPSIDPDDFD
jgi:hypothetical protein